MSNILKRFFQPSAQSYVFPKAEELKEEESPKEPEAPPEEETVEEEKEPSPIDFAQIQAEKILEDARQQAEVLAEEIRAQAQQEAEELREAAKTEGFRLGYQEGQAQARLEGQQQLEKLQQEQCEQVAKFLERATKTREEILAEMKGELCELCLTIAEKVIRVSLKSSADVMARMIQVATEKLKRREWVHIYVGGGVAKQMASVQPDLISSLSGLSDHVKIVPMTDDEVGSCIIEMPDEIIDISASTQLNNIREIMRDL